MATRNQRILTLSRLSGLLLLVAFVLLNAVLARSAVRVDLTEDKIYTLSDGARRILGALEDPATLKVFWHNVPETGETQRRYLAALFEEMRSAARGRLSVRWVDASDEDGQREAEDAGVQKTPFQVRGEGQLEIKEGYDSLVLEMGDDKQIVPHLVNEGPQVEYMVASALSKMQRKEEVVVGLVSPDPPPMPFQGGPSGRFGLLRQVLQDQFGQGAKVALDLSAPIPPDVQVLLVVAPKDLEEKAVYHLEQFVLRGGKLALFVDPVSYDVLGGRGAREATSGLADWLAHLGLTIERGVVGDFRSMTNLPYQSDVGGMRALQFRPYPYWPLLRGAYMSQESPATRGLDQIPLYWPAAISVDESKQTAAKRTATVLARTTNGGYRRPDTIGIERQEPLPPREELEEISVLVLLEGPMTSFWEGKPAPGEEKSEASGDEGEGAPPPDVETGTGSPDGGDEPPPGEGEEGSDPAPEEPPVAEEPPPAAGEDETEAPKEEGPPRLDAGAGMLVLLTDADLASDDAMMLERRIGNIVPGYANGFVFVQNLLDWMGGSDDLLSLRARARNPRVIEDQTAAEQRLMKWANYLVMPLLVFFAGIVVFIVRRYQS